MGLKFVNITVDTTALQIPPRRSFGTAGIVGFAPNVTTGVAQLFRGLADAEEVYGEDSGITRSLGMFFENFGRDVFAIVHEATTEVQRTFSGTGAKRDFELPYFPLPPLTVQADLGSGIQAVEEGVHYDVDYGNKTIWFKEDYIPVTGTDNVLVDGYSATPAQIEEALDELLKENIQLVCVSYCFDPSLLAKLKDHLVKANSGGHYRSGIAALPKGEYDETNVTTFLSGIKTDDLIVVGHNMIEDAAAGVLGMAAYYPPNQPLTAKAFRGSSQTEYFSDDELYTLAGDGGLTTTGLNIFVIDRSDRSNIANLTGWAYTVSDDSALRYFDTVRVIQAIRFELEAQLTSSRVIGNAELNVSKTGMAALHNILDGIMYQFTVRPKKWLEGFTVLIPLEEVVNNEPNLTAGEAALWTNAILARTADFEVEVDYRGSLNTITGKVRIVPGGTATAV